MSLPLCFYRLTHKENCFEFREGNMSEWKRNGWCLARSVRCEATKDNFLAVIPALLAAPNFFCPLVIWHFSKALRVEITCVVFILCNAFALLAGWKQPSGGIISLQRLKALFQSTFLWSYFIWAYKTKRVTCLFTENKWIMIKGLWSCTSTVSTIVSKASGI